MPGEERKEIWVDARDLQQKDEDGNEIPLETYKQQLDQRGREKLAEYRMVETINSGVDYQANLVYKKDFDLGDYCTYINTEVNIATDKRITEVMETYEGCLLYTSYNIRNVVYNRNSSSYKNFAYVAGAGEGSDRIIITVDARLPGEERKEIWVDARDLQQKDEDGNEIPLETYKQQLDQRGREKLAEYRMVETINSGVDYQANLVYKKMCIRDSIKGPGYRPGNKAERGY